MSVITALGQIAVREDESRTRWLLLPTGTAANRAFLSRLAINDEERRLLAMPSRDIEVRMDGNLGRGEAAVMDMVARIVRRESYFRAVLIHSRGQPAASRCANRCASLNSVPRFLECVRIPGFQGGACSSCIWQSHGSRCAHTRLPPPADNDEDDDDDEDDEDDEDDDDDGSEDDRARVPVSRRIDNAGLAGSSPSRAITLF
ncbi:hypothetical protein MAPG_01825 [Magnaporthiopsis poae ATCC 64411]|uniref:Uncharacterized protein n=1 Tax=Magnaporthiopsis poae (strain ATCC 64411 / 73-15) TaxID=644358 RepID=A0A0C4DPQ4_MAGP6|nr:hypothetical protein MAPG_01825 [Magnaporthiopsis poae ATCC 64411]